jgi:hypothetical protein
MLATILVAAFALMAATALGAALSSLLGHTHPRLDWGDNPDRRRLTRAGSVRRP